MKSLKPRAKPGGQALIELVLVLPLLVAFLAGTVSLLTYAVIPLWMEELTNLDLRIPEIVDLPGILHENRKGSMVPPYPAPSDLEINTLSKTIVRFPYPLNQYFPGKLRKNEVSLDISTYIGTVIPFFGHLPGVREPVFTSLRMVPFDEIKEVTIRDRLRRVVFPGSAMEVITGKLETLGVKLVHINLDALPADRVDGDLDRE